jgi:hypothetical protein
MILNIYKVDKNDVILVKMSASLVMLEQYNSFTSQGNNRNNNLYHNNVCHRDDTTTHKIHVQNSNTINS